MKPISEREFDVSEAPEIRTRSGADGRAKRGLAAILRIFRERGDPDRLPGRLRLDAGVDEAGVEWRRIANAPLIR